MDATVTVELGADDACLEVPWQAGELRYYDLKRNPELLLQVAEANHNREIAEFLASINSPLSMLETAKCDTWLSDEIEEQEKIFAANWKFGSYVDLMFADSKARFARAGHENFADRIARLLRRAPDLASSAEFIVRRCYFHEPKATDAGPAVAEGDAGFYITFYLFGYGDDEDEARRRWGIALKVVENALLQLSAMHRRGSDQTAPSPPDSFHALGGTG